MAKIVYGVAGEGFGHSSRAHLIGQKLLDQGHEVRFAGYNKSYRYLQEHFPDRVYEIDGFEFVYRDVRIALRKTIAKNIQRFPHMRQRNHRFYEEVLDPFGAELVITDFEPFTTHWAARNEIPTISIDNEHLLTKCDYAKPDEPSLSGMLSTGFTHFYLRGISAYLVINFFQARSKDPRVEIVPPIVREALLRFKASDGAFILCYATSKSWKEQYLSIFGHFPRQRFVLYGFDEESRQGNCEFRKHATEGFLADLAACKGVIATGGFSLLSECLYLRKKMLMNPIRKQYEQKVNAFNMQRLGLALTAETLSVEAVEAFLEFVKTPISDHQEVLWPDNQAFFASLDRTMQKVTKQRLSLTPASKL